jgi:glycosyltransferase involved in cell wall biosynthesis
MVSNYGWTLFNFRRRLIAALLAHDIDVAVQTEFDGYEGKLGLPAARVLPLKIDRKGVNPFRDLRTLLSVWRAIRSFRAELCLLFTIKPIVYGGLACRLSCTSYVANVTGLGTAFIGRRWLRWIAVLLYRISLRSAHRVFFQNNTDLELFVHQKIVKAGQAALLPGSGVDLERFEAAAYPAGPEIRFVLIARMLWDKGVGEFASAARLARRANPQARFQLLGPVDAVNRSAIPRETIQQWVREGTLEYLGETDDVRPFIAAAHCVVLPSYREGTPRSLLEAAAMGRPVIATDAVGCRDVVDQRSTGLLCAAGDANDLARRIIEMASLSPHQRADMGLRGRRKVEQQYDERVVIQRYVELLRELA